MRGRVVRAAVSNPGSSQDGTVTLVERSGYHNLGRRWWANSLGASTRHELIDSMLLPRTSSSSGVNVERMDVRREMERSCSTA